MTGKYGQTVGKWACRVKVLDVSEQKLSMKHAVLRSVPLLISLVAWPILLAGPAVVTNGHTSLASGIRILLAVQLGWFFLEFVTMLSNAKRRAIHDFIARSVVVRCAD